MQIRLGPAKIGVFLLLFVTLFLTLPAQAGTVDLRDLPGNFDQSPWNGGGTRLYAQSLVPDDAYLTLFAFRPDSNGGSQTYQIYVTGARAVAGGLGFAPDFTDVRFVSDVNRLAPVVGFQEISCNPDIAVTPDETIFLVFDGFTSEGPSADVRATEFNGTEQYPPGEFVFSNSQYGPPPDNGMSWSHRSGNNEDLAILAVFDSAPGGAALDCGETAFRRVPTLSGPGLAFLVVLLLTAGLVTTRRILH